MRTLVKGRPVEDPDWGLAPATFHAEWAHVPVPPFRAQAWTDAPVGEVRQAAFEVSDDFGWMMERFCTRFAPPAVGITAVVLDETFRVVLGTCAARELIAKTGIPAWYGVRAAFEWMENSDLYDPIDLAMWEYRAMEQATGAPV